MNVLVGVSGGIACYKSVALVSLLKKQGHDVRVVMTQAAEKLVSFHTFQSISGNPVARSVFDADAPHEVKHISWSQWADAAVLAPATANTIGKLAVGIADNMLTTMWLALTCPVVVVPAMNSAMLANRAVQANLDTLGGRGMYVMEPAAGLLACGTTGKGRMPEPEEIAAFLTEKLKGVSLEDPGLQGPLMGKHVLITAGPTQEPIDPVRFITNRSSGKMGYALAEEAHAQGALVTLVSGPVSLAAPESCTVVPVRTADEMYQAVMEHAPAQDVVICAAAVSDYRPVTCFEQKIKKHDEELVVRMERTEDILAALGKEKRFLLVGFAAETENLAANAERKLKKKNLDLIVANDVSGSDVGFDSDDNAVTILGSGGLVEQVSRRSKREVAQAILTVIGSALENERG